MVFIDIPCPLHQDAPDSCIPTCIKVILDTQFNIQRRISCIKKWVGYKLGCGSCSPYQTPVRLEEPLLSLGLVSSELKNATHTKIIELLKNKIIPFIFIKIAYLNEISIKNIKTYEGAEEWWHCVAICGFDEANENIFIYDPYFTYSNPPLTENTCPVKISYALLTKYWKATNNRIYWIAHKKGSSKKEKDLQLTNF
jgi:hypothetical protein